MSYSTQNFTRNNESRLSFICVTCCTKFPTAELQRKHMKSEFHRYNLKRRISNLPSITSEIFVEKVLKQREDEEIERKRIDEKKKKEKIKENYILIIIIIMKMSMKVHFLLIILA